MASFSAARSVFRATSAGRTAAARFSSKPKASPASPFHSPANKPLSQPIFRRPVESFFCVESLMPYHTATASAVMNSMLSVSPRSYCWLLEGL